MGVTFSRKSQSSQVNTYVDADWATCPSTRRSISRFLVLWNREMVSWKSRKQPTVTLSTTKAEYKAAAKVVKEVLWVRTLAHEVLGEDLEARTVI